MKTFKIIMLLLATTLISCDGNDDGFYNSEYLTIPNLVTIETQPTYALNDYIYVNALLNRLQNEENQTTSLDLRKSTGNAPSFSFTYVLEHKVNNEWLLITDSSDIVLTEGRIFSGGFFDAYADFDDATDAYKFRAGIQLQDTGEYRLSFGYNSGNSEVDLRSNSTGNNVFLNIKSATGNLNGDGYYLFTVN